MLEEQVDQYGEIHDLLLANYILLRRVNDCLVSMLPRDRADKLIDLHERGKFLTPDVFIPDDESLA